MYKSDFQKTNTNINYMIVKARDELNQAMKTLLSNDSKFRTFHIERLAREEAAASTDEGSSDKGEAKPARSVFKVGSICLKAG